MFCAVTSLLEFFGMVKNWMGWNWWMETRCKMIKEEKCVDPDWDFVLGFDGDLMSPCVVCNKQPVLICLALWKIGQNETGGWKYVIIWLKKKDVTILTKILFWDLMGPPCLYVFYGMTSLFNLFGMEKNWFEWNWWMEICGYKMSSNLFQELNSEIRKWKRNIIITATVSQYI